jgi:hypothetical protein
LPIIDDAALELKFLGGKLPSGVAIFDSIKGPSLLEQLTLKMASRLIQKAQLLKQAPIRQAVRNYASESKQAVEHFPEESK